MSCRGADVHPAWGSCGSGGVALLTEDRCIMLWQVRELGQRYL